MNKCHYSLCYIILILFTMLQVSFGQNSTKQTKDEYIEELKKIALSISLGDEDLDQSIRAERLYELADLAGCDNIVDILLQITNDKYPDVRTAIITCLGRTTQKNTEIEKTLKESLKDSHPGVRLAAIQALNLKNIFPKDKDTVAINLAEGNGIENWSYQGYMPKSEIVKLKQDEQNDILPKTGVRASILGQIRYKIRKEAMNELQKINTERSLNALKTLKRDSDAEIRNHAKKIIDGQNVNN
jgi:HEAT repeat protein